MKRPGPWQDLISHNSIGWALTDGGAASLLEGAGDPGREQDEFEAAVVVRKDSYIPLHQQEYSLEFKGNNYFPVTGTGEATSGVLNPVWGVCAQKRGKQIRESTTGNHQDSQGAEALDVQGEAEGAVGNIPRIKVTAQLSVAFLSLSLLAK